jgi:hypothetical protein
MKKTYSTLTMLTLLAGTVGGYAQGQVYIGDYLNTDFQITVWGPQAGDPTTALTGNSAANFGNGTTTGGDIPAGTQAGYTGSPLGGSATGATSSSDYANGNLWSVQLYAAAGSGVPATSLLPVAGTVSTFYTTTGQEGLWTSTATATIPGAASATPATMQIRAWYNGGGTIGSYEAAVLADMPAGESTTGSENIGGGSVTPPDLPGPGNTGVTGGITSFNVTGVPEPSTIVLGVMGACSFLLRRKKA